MYKGQRSEKNFYRNSSLGWNILYRYYSHYLKCWKYTVKKELRVCIKKLLYQIKKWYPSGTIFINLYIW